MGIPAAPNNVWKLSVSLGEKPVSERGVNKILRRELDTTRLLGIAPKDGVWMANKSRNPLLSIGSKLYQGVKVPKSRC